MGLTQTVAPAKEPITVPQAKTHLRVDTDDENSLISSLIVTARRMAEAYTSRQLITATYTLDMNDFPYGYGVIWLPRTPLGAVSGITYVDTAGDTQTLATTVYEAISNDTTAKIVLKPAQDWPSVQSDKYNAATVTFTAGYGSDPADVPETVQSGMLILIGELFENRDVQIKDNQMISALLDTAAAVKVA
jgi:uncharacterized phiE125 gp8 family phage protein